jgi:hypothetical protein
MDVVFLSFFKFKCKCKGSRSAEAGASKQGAFKEKKMKRGYIWQMANKSGR